MTLSWPQNVLTQLRSWSEKCYPYEGCGILLGQSTGDARKVRRFHSLSNLLHERNKVTSSHVMDVASASLGKRVESQGQFEFVMNPEEFNRAVLAAEKEGLDVVGVLHTHPDHPAKPSATDAAQPLLAGWSNVIVRVDKGRFIEARSWFRREESDPFQEETITVEG